MELEQLRQIVAIAEAGTISEAAEVLHISQPALSRSVRRLEADLGCELFDRARNSVRMNDAGRLAVEHAEAVLAEVQRMRDAFDERARRLRTLRIASVAPAPTWRVTALVVAANPTTILETELVSEQDVERALFNRTCDLAVTLHPVHLPTVRATPLMTESLALTVQSNHELAGRESISFAEMDGYPFLMLEDIGFWMELTRRNLPSSQIVTMRDRNVFMQLLASSDLCGFTTEIPENDVGATGRVAIPITDADATATFFLNVLADAPERVLNAYEAAVTPSQA